MSHWKVQADLLLCLRGRSSSSAWPKLVRSCSFTGVPVSSSSFAVRSRLRACSQHACSFIACQWHEILQRMLGTDQYLADHRAIILSRLAMTLWLHDGHQMPVALAYIMVCWKGYRCMSPWTAMHVSSDSNAAMFRTALMQKIRARHTLDTIWDACGPESWGSLAAHVWLHLQIVDGLKRINLELHNAGGLFCSGSIGNCSVCLVRNERSARKLCRDGASPVSRTWR